MKVLRQSDTLVIIPVFNEENNIGLVLDELEKKCKDADILVVNDGSFDKTAEILESKNVLILNHAFNMGIGTSLETGCQFALEHSYSYVVRMDGDGQHDPAYIKDVLTPVKNSEADIVIGSRFLGSTEFKSTSLRLLGIKIISFVLTLITRKKVTDPTSGFCAMNSKAFEFFSRFCPDDYPEPEILIYHKNFRIKEIPISINKRYSGASSITPLRSVYYMIKVMLSLFMHIFRKETK